MATKTKKPARDHYQEITDRLVSALEESLSNNFDEKRTWNRPWASLGAGMAPRNAVTGRFYRGINLFILSFDPRNADDPRWMTYKQAQSKGWQVRKGEKSVEVYLFRPVERQVENKDGEEETQKGVILRTFNVFHVSQVDGDIPAFDNGGPQPELKAWEKHDLAEQVIDQAGADISFGGNRACYVPSRDQIHLPKREQFSDAYGFYGTIFHELGHWSLHQSRLGRRANVGGGPFGSAEYAREEVRVEMAAAIVAGVLGIDAPYEGDEQHLAYLGSWLKVIRDDKYEVRRAAADAQKIADYLLPAGVVEG